MRNPDSHSAMGGHSGALARRFYKGLLELFDTPEYCFEEIFRMWHPDLDKVVESKLSEPDFTINLGNPDAFSTIACRGIDGTWTGAIDVSSDGYLYVDDLVRDREHSLSPSRLENTFQEYQTKMVDRMNDGARELMVGTLWNVNDPLERMRRNHEDDKKYLFLKIPALDSDDKSNFDYEYKGFSTQYYKDMRDRLDMAEWMAKYQQQPFVREGLLFPVDTLLYFDGVLEEGEHRVIAAIDPAFGGGDSLSMPVCADFSKGGRFIIDWLHNPGTVGKTVPMVVDKIEAHHITYVRVEKNNGGKLYADKLMEEMYRRDIHFCKIDCVSAPHNISKNDKIGGYADFIMRTFQFLMPNKKMAFDVIQRYKRSPEYDAAMDELCMYSPEVKKIKDDAPDSITQLAMIFDRRAERKARVIKSPI